MDPSGNTIDNTNASNQSDTKTITLMCFSLACCDKPKHVVDRIAHSNKIFLPESMLYEFKQEPFPLYFKLTQPDYGVSTVCGVEEFTAPPGCFIVPHRIMEHLLICDGQNIDIQLCHPLKGTYLNLKPRKTAFIELSNPKAVLERFLSKDYPVVSVGDTISINHVDKIYHIDVVECKPGNSIDILNTDVNLDFSTPTDYVEPPKITNSIQEQTKDDLPQITGVNRKIAFPENTNKQEQISQFKKLEKTGVFVPFSGKGHRLGSN
jgi:ubiquitin fusion degradation protein 1